MLKVFFGLNWEAIRDPDTYFKYRWREEWFEDALVKDMVKDIDDTIVLSPHCMESSVLGQIPPERLSGGVKSLILMLKEPEVNIDLICCGENCSDWIVKIGELKGITVSMSGYDLFTDGRVISVNALCLNDNSIISNSEDWHRKAGEFVGVSECGERRL